MVPRNARLRSGEWLSRFSSIGHRGGASRASHSRRSALQEESGHEGDDGECGGDDEDVIHRAYKGKLGYLALEPEEGARFPAHLPLIAPVTAATTPETVGSAAVIVHAYRAEWKAWRLVRSEVRTASPKELETRLMMLVMAEARPTSSVGISTRAAVWAGMLAKAMTPPRSTTQKVIVAVAVARLRSWNC